MSAVASLVAAISWILATARATQAVARSPMRTYADEDKHLFQSTLGEPPVGAAGPREFPTNVLQASPRARRLAPTARSVGLCAAPAVQQNCASSAVCGDATYRVRGGKHGTERLRRQDGGLHC